MYGSKAGPNRSRLASLGAGAALVAAALAGAPSAAVAAAPVKGACYGLGGVAACGSQTAGGHGEGGREAVWVSKDGRSLRWAERQCGAPSKVAVVNKIPIRRDGTFAYNGSRFRVSGRFISSTLVKVTSSCQGATRTLSRTTAAPAPDSTPMTADEAQRALTADYAATWPGGPTVTGCTVVSPSAADCTVVLGSGTAVMRVARAAGGAPGDYTFDDVTPRP